jgi:hypothetical protein
VYHDETYAKHGQNERCPDPVQQLRHRAPTCPCCAASWLANNFRCDDQMNFFADDRGTCIHAKITTVDDSGCLESDPLTSASKFAINLDIEVDQPCDAEVRLPVTWACCASTFSTRVET